MKKLSVLSKTQKEQLILDTLRESRNGFDLLSMTLLLERKIKKEEVYQLLGALAKNNTVRTRDVRYYSVCGQYYLPRRYYSLNQD